MISKIMIAKYVLWMAFLAVSVGDVSADIECLLTNGTSTTTKTVSCPSGVCVVELIGQTAVMRSGCGDNTTCPSNATVASCMDGVCCCTENKCNDVKKQQMNALYHKYVATNRTPNACLDHRTLWEARDTSHKWNWTPNSNTWTDTTEATVAMCTPKTQLCIAKLTVYADSDGSITKVFRETGCGPKMNPKYTNPKHKTEQAHPVGPVEVTSDRSNHYELSAEYHCYTSLCNYFWPWKKNITIESIMALRMRKDLQQIAAASVSTSSTEASSSGGHLLYYILAAVALSLIAGVSTCVVCCCYAKTKEREAKRLDEIQRSSQRKDEEEEYGDELPSATSPKGRPSVKKENAPPTN